MMLDVHLPMVFKKVFTCLVTSIYCFVFQGGLVALGVQMGHFTCLHRQHKAPEETRQHCLLSTIALHTLSPSSDNSSTNKKRKKKYNSAYKHSSSSKVLETVPEHEDKDSGHKERVSKILICKSQLSTKCLLSFSLYM